MYNLQKASIVLPEAHPRTLQAIIQSSTAKMTQNCLMKYQITVHKFY